MDTTIIAAIVTGAFSLGVAVITGIFSSRAYLKRQFTQAERDAVSRRAKNQERALKTRSLISAICRVLFWIVFVLEKDVAQNGELDKLKGSMADVNQAEDALKEVERRILEEG